MEIEFSLEAICNLIHRIVDKDVSQVQVQKLTALSSTSNNLMDLIMQSCRLQQFGDQFQIAALKLLSKAIDKGFIQSQTNIYQLQQKGNVLRQYIFEAIEKYYYKREFIDTLRSILKAIFQQSPYEGQKSLDLVKEKLISAQKQRALPIIHLVFAVLRGFQNGFFYQNTKSVPMFQQIWQNLLTFIYNNSSGQIVYLGVKSFWKIISLKKITVINYDWLIFLKQIIDKNDPQFQTKADYIQVKNSPQFFYFRSKKFAFKILSFLVENYQGEQLKQFNQQLLPSIISLNNQELPSLIRYYHLLYYYNLAKYFTLNLEPYRQLLQYSVLLPFIGNTEKEKQTMLKHPQNYLFFIENREKNIFSVTIMAVQLWIALAKAESLDINKREAILLNNLNFIIYLLESEQNINKQIAFNILNKFFALIIEQEQIKIISLILVQRYFLKQFLEASHFSKNNILNFFIDNHEQILICLDYTNPIIQELIKMLQSPTQIVYVKYKCFILICILGCKINLHKALMEKAQLLVSVFQDNLLIFPLFQFIDMFDRLICQYSECMSPYYLRIVIKLIQFMTHDQKDTRYYSIQLYDYVTIINRLLQKTLTNIQTYSECILFSKYLFKYLIPFNQINCPLKRILKIIRNFIEKAYQIYKENRQAHSQIWNDMINFQSYLHESIKSDVVEIVKRSEIHQMQELNSVMKYYMRINQYFAVILRKQVPQALLNDILQFHGVLEGFSSSSTIKRNYIFLFSHILEQYTKYNFQMKRIWLVVNTVLQVVDYQIITPPHDKINRHVQIANKLFALQNKPEQLVPLFERIFVSIINTLIKQQQQQQMQHNFEQQVDSIQFSEEDSSGVVIGFYRQELFLRQISDQVLYLDFKNTLETIQKQDHSFYLRLISKIPQDSMEKFMKLSEIWLKETNE